jgi:N-acetylglucosaminyldiphosphoundecaprenol N-acetyl-beta-D-mannosaminyltransferase
MACRSSNFLRLLLSADLLFRDGSGMRILFRAVGADAGCNMNGTDLIPKLLLATAGTPVVLYGSTSEVALEAGKKLTLQGINVIATCDGFRPTEHYLERLRIDCPRVVVLAMGMPKQEAVAEALKASVEGPLLIINGGAILDFIAGRFQRAPVWLRKAGFEWLYRLLHEPRRLWRRYVVGNVMFLMRTLLLAIVMRGSEPQK